VIAMVSCKDDKPEIEKVYTVTFNSDGGSPVPANQEVKEGETATAPTTNPTKQGYVFMFWHLSGMATAYDFQMPVNSNITLVAKWEEEAKVEYWQVTWVLGGGAFPTPSNHATQVAKGGTLVEPNPPVMTNNIFDGWYKEATLTNKAAFPLSVTADITLYAKWEIEVEPQLSVSPDIPITFTKDGGIEVISITTNQPSWNATSNREWCTITKETDLFIVSVSENTATSVRTATITVSAGRATNVIIEITQAAAAPYLSVSSDNIPFTADGGTKTFTFTTNQPKPWSPISWEYSGSWLTVTNQNDQFSVTTSAYTGAAPRTSTLTIRVGNAPSKTVTITQIGTDPQLLVSPDVPISFTLSGGAKTIEVVTNQPSWNAVSDQTWCTIVKEGNQFTITAAPSGNAFRSATITVTAGSVPSRTLYVTQASGTPNIAFVARNPVQEYLYSNGFFIGSRLNFNLIVYDDAGFTSIIITEVGTGAPNGNNRKTFTQTRLIPISGPGTYQLSQEIVKNVVDTGDIWSQFNYTVSAHGKSYTTNYRGTYTALYNSWSHHFVLK